MIEDVVKIAKEAGSIIREGFGKNITIEFKTNESNLVTDIDKASEKTITEFIRKKYPTHNILAEEGGETRSTSEYRWIVDPLDGTTNFAHGLPIFSVSIGIQKNGKTIIGVVYDVMADAVYSAELGNGAYSDNKKLSVSKNSKLGQSLLVTGFPYNIADNPENALQKFSAAAQQARGVRRLGSAAIDFCYVAKGVFDGFWEVHLHPWDVCAGKLLVEEAGGVVTDFNGKEIDVFSKRILATNKLLHPVMTELLMNN